MNRALLFSLLVLCFVSCKKKDVETVNLGLSYYPNSLSSHRVYEVDSIVYNPFTLSVDSFHFEIKDVLLENYADGAGRKKTRVQRWKRSKEHYWLEVSAWAFYKDPFLVEEQHNNRHVISLQFPVQDGKKWEANIKNTNKSQQYTYVSTGEKNINGQPLKGVVTVEQMDESDQLQLEVKRSYEKYADGVGMVYKYEKYLKKFTTGEPDDEAIDSGLIYIMKIKSYHIL